MNLLDYEEAHRAQGFRAVCGVDEAGRGPLAGPVFAAAVLLHPGQTLPGVNDSKKLSEKKREALFDTICQEVRGYGIAMATPEEIDALNILQATFLAMGRAVAQLPETPDMVLVDGNLDPRLGLPTLPIVGGDGLSLSIAAASILAKVSRDRYMVALGEAYPQYQFQRHKGYPTALHYQLLREHGVSPVHRQSFLKKFLHAEATHGGR